MFSQLTRLIAVILATVLATGCASTPTKPPTAISDFFLTETHEGGVAMWKWARDDIYVKGSDGKLDYVGTTMASEYTPYAISSLAGSRLSHRTFAISKDGRSIVFNHWGPYAPKAAKSMKNGVYRYEYDKGLKLIHSSYRDSWTTWPKPLPANILPHNALVTTAITAEGEEFPLVLLEGKALHLTALDGRTEDCARLVKNGADINARTYWDYTPIQLAIIMGHEGTAIRLSKLGADATVGAEIPALLTAINLGRLKTVQAILESGHTDIQRLDQYRILQFAATQGKYGAAGLTGFFGDIVTPRSLIDSHTSLKMLSLLMKHGVDVNARSTKERTVLFEWDISVEIIEFLLDHGADINAVDQAGNTVLHAQVFGQYKLDGESVLKLVIPRMKEIDAKNANGLTPLQLAAQRRNFETAMLLVAYGADDQVPFVQMEIEVKREFGTVRDILADWEKEQKGTKGCFGC